jgi:CRISPR system Cascade subunit CasD
MQSWGVQSRFGVRDTGLEPSKSGVLGLACAAMGIARTDEAQLAQLAHLIMGVRVDREGRLRVDYHTASNVLKAGGGLKDTELSNRYYLADALFLVGLAGDDLPLLKCIHAALRNPVWPLFLGRKAFVPGQPVWLVDGLKPNSSLQDALACYPPLTTPSENGRFRLVLEDPDGVIVRSDQPISFQARRFAPRRLTIQYVTAPSQEVS